MTCSNRRLDAIYMLVWRGALTSYSDPFVLQLHTEGIEMRAVDAEAIRAADGVVIVTDRS